MYSMVIKDYEKINTWIFDLDHTLYPAPSAWEKRAFSHFFQYIEEHYGIPVAESEKLDVEFDKQGFYLKGWLEHIPHFDVEHWWQQIDAVDATDIPVCKLTQKKIHDLPGNKVLFTNGHPSHADKFLKHLGLSNHFDEVISINEGDIRRARFKPNPDIYHEIMTKMKTKGENCAMFEDNLSNLVTAHKLGMSTVLLNQPECHRHLPHVHKQHDTFTDWLKAYMPK
ncbi:MAG: putative hydrolase of the HAD superfamily [Alphaproteobacteria bacterium]|jgi:putative hydrolase of the HAD superfamily